MADMMRDKEEVMNMRESAVYKSMFKDIIKNQIQMLVDQLAYAGEESVLVTWCGTECSSLGNFTIGSELGQQFLQREGEVHEVFKRFCFSNSDMKVPSSLSTCDLDLPLAGSADVPGFGLKRKLFDVNGEDNENSSKMEQTSPCRQVTKRSRSVTSSLKAPAEMEEKQTGDIDIQIPKSLIKCSLCSYMSKFKANVTRHERSVHRINMEGVPAVSVQYACALCQYKSPYRSNLMRHEKNIHKVDSSTMELESRKIPLPQPEDDISAEYREPVQFDTDTGNQSIINDGNQIYTDETGTSDGNQIYIDETGTSDGNQSIINDGNQIYVQHTGTSDGKQSIINDGSQIYIQQTGTSDENQSYMEVDTGDNVNDETYDENDDDNDDKSCHICKYCQEMFNCLSKLRKHIDSNHSVDHFNCKKCAKSFNNLICLQGHMATHNASKKEVCACGKAFQYRTSLMRHERKCEFSKISQENKSSEATSSEKSSHETRHQNAEPETCQNESEADEKIEIKTVTENLF